MSWAADEAPGRLGDTTLDGFLDGALSVEQPRRGYRAAIDPVILAAAVPARPGERVFEAGAGVGVASLCLARRVPGLTIEAAEIDGPTAALLAANVVRNGLEGSIRVARADILARSPARAFDHVVSNPPYLEADRASPSPDAAKNRAHVLGPGGIAAWIGACLRRLRPGGALTLILRADGLDAALGALSGRCGGITIIPLWPRHGEAARRIIIRGVKGSRRPLTLAPGLALHEGPGFSAGALAILRGAAALD